MAGYYDRDRNTTAAGHMGWPEAHLGSTGEFLVSGYPYTYGRTNNSGGSETKTIAFVFVTKFIQITAVDGNATISVQGGANFVVPSGSTIYLEVKATDLSITIDDLKSYTVIAGLTTVKRARYPTELGTLATVS